MAGKPRRSPFLNDVMPERSFPHAVSINATGGGVPIAGDCLLLGWALEEVTGVGPARVVLIDGGDANGQPVAPVTLLAGQSVRDNCGPLGLLIRTGLFFNVTLGTVGGTVWVCDL